MPDQPLIPTVSVIFTNPQGEILLQLRDHQPRLYPNHWTLPGGYVELGETPEQAIHREMFEEMELTNLNLSLWKTFTAPRGDPPILCAEHIFTGKLTQPITTLHEGCRIAWFTHTEAANIELAFNYSPILREFIASCKS